MKKILLLILFCIAFLSSAQLSKWSDLFSYNNVKYIRENNGSLVAATENGIFYYNPSTGEIRKLSKANGLHEVKISAFDYDSASQTGIVGYYNGYLDVITPEGVFLIADIPIATSYTGNKQINHISITGDKAIISTGYGVSVFNVSRREFGDTTFFVNGGIYEAVNAAVIKDNIVFAATNNGIKTHEMNSTFPVYTSWATLRNGSFKKIDYQDVLVAAGNNQVYYGTPTSLNLLSKTFISLQDMKVVNSNIVIADDSQAYIFSSSGTQQKTLNVGEQINTALVLNNTLYTGTKLSGMYNEQKTSIKPDGPYNNTSYKISLLNNNIWISSGKRISYNTPDTSYLGYYHYNGGNWVYPEYFRTNTNFNILDVTPNPSNPTEVFFSNYVFASEKGIYKMVNDELSKAYMINDPEIYYNRPIGCIFDSSNNLICTSTYMNGTAATGFYYLDKNTDQFVSKNLNVAARGQKPVTKDGILYIPVPLGGMIVYDYNNTITNTSDDVFKFLTKSGNNLPSNNCYSVAVDKNNDVWIGNDLGLRILSNPKSAILQDNPQTEDIVIEENGLGEELFRDAAVLQITVDSGNQKWISIDGGGVFYISPDGQKTINHFTRLNSPLPNDTVTDIQIDSKTGKVYFATIDGVVVYQGDVGDVTSNFGDVLVYPNPVVYAQYKGNVRIRGLAQKTNVRITDAAGNLVHSTVANGGYFEWNLQNQRGVRVASGIYYVLMTNEDGTDTATAKIAVVN